MSTSPTLSRAERFAAMSRGITESPPDHGDRARVTATPAAPTEVVVGILERLTKVSDSWAIGSVYSDERKSVNVVGACLNDLVEGNEYTFSGQKKFHSKFGEQLDVVAAMPYVKPDRASIIKYMARNFKGVGQATATKYIEQRLKDAEDQDVALEEVRQQLLNSPWTLDLSGVAKKASFKGDADEESPALAYVHRDLATRLGGIPGLKDRVLRTLAHYLLKLHPAKKGAAGIDPQIVQKCWASLVQDPYEPTNHVPGFAFTSADAIGASVNIPRDAPVRLKALVAYALDTGCRRSGHTYLNQDFLAAALKKADPRAPIDQSIQYGLESEMIVLDASFGESRYYTPQLYEAEVELAKGLARLCKTAKPLSKHPADKLAEKIQEVAKATVPALKDKGLDESQVKALVGILTAPTRLHTLTAGPGCGKTQLMEILAKLLEHKDFIFCGPTGKSAKVLSNRLASQGLEASTIHSTLQGAGRGSFRFNATNTLDGDILVVDESSMNDVEIAEALVAAMNDGMHLIALGDDEQLPSIGPGRFLRDILQISQGDHHRLVTTHRNSGGILDVLQQIRQGHMDCEDLPGVTFSHGLRTAQEQFPEIAHKYIQAVSKHGYEGVALLMSMRAGEPSVPAWNITYANQVLRDLCNPHAEKVPGTRLFVGDRIIIRENMIVPIAGSAPVRPDVEREDGDVPGDGETRVVNGDTGTILSYERDSSQARSLMPRSLRLKLDDGRIVDLPGSEMNTLQHSYALTVHSAQGSEYKKVIAVITPGHPSFINRAMLFTGLSRAREDLDINADDAVLRKIAATPLPERCSALVERVEQELSADADDDEDAPNETAPMSTVATAAPAIRPAPVAYVPQRPVAAAPAAAKVPDLASAPNLSRAQRFGSARVMAAPPPAPVHEMSLRDRYEMRQRG